VHLQGQGTFVSDAAVDRARLCFQRNTEKEFAERVLHCSYRNKRFQNPALVITSPALELETCRFNSAIRILQRFSLLLQTMTLLAHHPLARKKFSRSACVLFHFKGDGVWSHLFLENTILHALLMASPQLKEDSNDYIF
jgi:hypothetical protein